MRRAGTWQKLKLRQRAAHSRRLACAVGDSFAQVVLRRLIFVSIALLAAYPHATGQTPKAQTEVQYESSSVDFTTGETVFTKASLSDGPSLLTADEIRYNFITHVATANRNVTLTRGPQRLIAKN